MNGWITNKQINGGPWLSKYLPTGCVFGVVELQLKCMFIAIIKTSSFHMTFEGFFVCYKQWIDFYPNINIHLPTQPNANAWACAAHTRTHIAPAPLLTGFLSHHPGCAGLRACLPLFPPCTRFLNLPLAATSPSPAAGQQTPFLMRDSSRHAGHIYLRWQLKLSCLAQRRESHCIVTHLIELITQKDKMSEVKLASPAETDDAEGTKGRQNAKRRIW